MKELSDKIKRCLARELPGHRAHLAMAPKNEDGPLPREPEDYYREAGVLILLFPDIVGPAVLFIERTQDEGPHSGQISFPGGAREVGDFDIVATALREANEETGVKSDDIEIIGTLSTLYVPTSNFCVCPVVGVHRGRPGFVPSPDEVENIVIAPLELLMDPTIRREEKMQTKRHRWTAPYYDIAGHHIWGATAMITSEFLSILDGCA